MPSRFLNNITVNDEYTLPSTDGTADQIITTDGAGQLSFVDQSTLNSGSAERTEILVKNVHGSALSKGDPVYIVGSVGASDRLEVALANASNSAKMPCVGLLTQDLANNGEGTATVNGKLKNLITSPIDGATPTENDTIYVKPGGGLTLTKPTGSTNLIQNVGQVGRVSTSSDGNIVVSAILRSNDVPNLPTGKIWVGDGNTTISDVVYLDEANGRMGIGTTSPSYKLEVDTDGVHDGIKIRGSNAPGLTLQDDTSDSTSSILIQSTAVAQGNLRISADENNVASGATIEFKVSGGDKMRILANGNVGIGTTSPTDKLHINQGSDAFKGITIEGTTPALYLKDTQATNAYHIGANGNYLYFLEDSNQSGGYNNIMAFWDPSNNFIFQTGNVGIGTTNPSSRLEIRATDATHKLVSINRPNSDTAALYIGNDSASPANGVISSNYSDLIFGRDQSSTLTEHMRIKRDGNVGIGTTNPSEKLEVAGNARITGDVTLSNGNALRWTSDDVRIEGTTAGDNIKFYVANTEILKLAQSGTLATVTGNLRVTGAYYDSNNLPGTSGQVLSSTATGTDWVSLSEISGVDGTGTTNYVAKWSDTDTITDSVIYDNGTNVGIGTTSPASGYKLDVNGLGAFNTAISIQGVDTGNPTAANDEIRLSGYGIMGSRGSFYITNANAAGSMFFGIGGAHSNNTKMTINSSGVGIGTTSPSAPLTFGKSVYGNFDSENFYRIKLQDQGGTHNDVGIGQTASGNMGFNITSGNAFIFNNGTSGEIARFNGTGLGIGTTSPSEKLDVSGTGRFTSTLYTNSSSTSSVGIIGKSQANGWGARYDSNSVNYSGFYFDNNNDSGMLLRDDAGNVNVWLKSDASSYLNGGNVGIGTTSPTDKLTVQDGNIRLNSTSSYPAQGLYAYWNNSSPNMGGISWHNNPGFIGSEWSHYKQTSPYTLARIRLIGDASTGGMFVNLNSSDVFTIKASTGNVGIGTTSPSQKLDVNGNVKLSETAATTDTDKFVVLDSGVLKYRTGAQVLSDIGAGTGTVTGSGTTNYIPKWSNSSTLTDSGIVETSTLTTINNDSFEYDHLGTTYLNIDGTTGTFLLGQHSTANRVYIHGIQSHLRFYTNNVKAGEFDSNQNFLVNNGNVGIGIINPATKLHIGSSGSSGSTTEEFRIQTSSSGGYGGNAALNLVTGQYGTSGIYFGDNATYTSQPAHVRFVDVSNYIEYNSSGYHVFSYSGNEIFRTNGYNVGIGVTNPAEKLEVDGHVKAVDGYKGYVSDFHNGGFFHSPRSQDGANPLWIPINSTGMSSSDQYYNTRVPLYAGRVRKIILKHVSGSTPVATVCTFYKRINGTTSGTTYAGTVTGGGAAGMKVTFDFGTSNFTFNAEDEVQIGVVTGVATQPAMYGMSCQIWYEYNIT